MDPVEGQLAAYNARDIDRFLPYFSADVVVEDGTGTVLLHNGQEFKDKYAKMFNDFPELHCIVINRMRAGRFVVDEEEIHGRESEPIHCVVVYTLASDFSVIERIRILK